MSGNTAIFYDMENLLKGYSSSKNLIGSISLKNIVQEVEKIPLVNRIILQKAYANWSDPRLSVMKREINELGIEPIQIFGFSYYQKKNAADIQLAVDAIDLAYVRQAIDVFVIVSGDGGFSAVAKKLHEYGKYVIGCGYQSSSNQILESVCDYFITIEEPEDLQEERGELEKNLKITNPLVLRMSQGVDRIKTEKKEDIFQQAYKIINWFTEDTESKKNLSTSGIHLSVIKEAFKYGIENFNSSNLGFAKFIQFLQFICRETQLKVVNSPSCETKVIFKEVNLHNFEPLPYLDDSFLHSLENYKSILATSNPRIRVIDAQDFAKITTAICSLPEGEHTLDAIIEYVGEIYQEIDSESINHSLFSLIHLDIFVTPNPEQHISEQILSLKSEYVNNGAIINKFKDSIRTKLATFWGEELREDILEELISDL